MAVYTQLANETIEALLTHDYGLPELDFAVGIAEGVSNSNYLVAVKGKSGEEKYILTLYEKRIVEQEIPFFLNLMRHLAGKGIACPLPIPRKNGTLVGTIEGRPGALVSFLPGHSLTVFSQAHVASVGAALGRLHVAAKDFNQTRTNGLALPEWRTIFTKIETKLDRIEQGLSLLVRDELVYLEKHWPQDLSRGIIHADLFPNNVFFVDDAVSGLIDFYFACTDFYAYDLAIVLNAWCFDNATMSDAKARAMVMAYENVRPLSPTEKEVMPILLRGAAMRFLLTRAHDLIFHEKSALVTPLDPNEYIMKLKFHQKSGWRA